MKGAVFGHSMAVAKEKLAEIKADYERAGIDTEWRFGKDNSFFIAANGDAWQAIRANESARGYCINVAYIDNTIPYELIDLVIRPTIKAFPYQAIKYFHGVEDILSTS